MIGAARRYGELLTELLLERELAGGALPEEDESRYVEELDRCWWLMTNAEQDEAEKAFTEELEGPADLSVEDVLVEDGKHEPPRRAA